MKIVFGQGLSIFTILLTLAALLLYALWGWPNEDAWWSLLEIKYAEVPFGAWIIIILAIMSFSFSMNTLQKVRDQEKRLILAYALCWRQKHLHQRRKSIPIQSDYMLQQLN